MPFPAPQEHPPLAENPLLIRNPGLADLVPHHKGIVWKHIKDVMDDDQGQSSSCCFNFQSPCPCLHAYRAQMSRGNCAGGLLCRHLPACSTIMFFPAVLILRFIWRAQHNPDRYITKGTTRVTLYFRLSLTAWCITCDDGIFMKLSITSALLVDIDIQGSNNTPDEMVG